MHEDGRGCIFRGKVVLRHPLRNSGSKPYHLSTKTGELQIIDPSGDVLAFGCTQYSPEVER